MEPFFNESEIFHILEKGPMKPIGKGSFGSVVMFLYKGKEIAAKRLDQDPERNFHRELSMLKHVRDLHHSHIVECFEGYFWKAQQQAVILFEYMNLGSLYDILHKNLNLQYFICHALRWCEQISGAVGFLHSLELPDEHSTRPKGIIHRDLKPENVLMFDKYNSVKICDFGLARLDRSLKNSKKTCEAGTASYMAPEVYTGDYTVLCDVFSAGVMFCEVFGRKRPQRDFQTFACDKTPAVLRLLYCNCCKHQPDLRPTMYTVQQVLQLVLNGCPAELRDISVNEDPACRGLAPNDVEKLAAIWSDEATKQLWNNCFVDSH